MKIQIYICYDHEADNLKSFKYNATFRLNNNPNKNRIVFSQHLKLYAKNFDCAQPTIKRIISTAKNMKDGYVKRETI